MTLKDDLIAAKALIDTPEKCACGRKKTGMSLNQAVDNTSDDEDARYWAMTLALEASLPKVPPVKKNIVAWSHEDATHESIMLTFDRAIAAAEASA